VAASRFISSPAGVVRTLPSIIRVLNGDTNVSCDIVLRKANGERVHLRQENLAPGLGADIHPQDLSYMASDDLGVFMYFTEPGPGAGGSMQAYAPWSDVRRVRVTRTKISAAKTPVLAGAPAGNVIVNASGFKGFDGVAAINYSFGVSPDLQMSLSDGVTEIPFTFSGGALTQTLNPGYAGYFGDMGVVTGLSVVPLALPEGWTLYAQLVGPNANADVEVVTETLLTNLSPVREDQGGAY
jgi:hypothetical protein